MSCVPPRRTDGTAKGGHVPFVSWKEGGRQLPHVARCFIWPCDAKCRIRMWGSLCRIRTALVGTKEFLGAHDFHRDIAGAHHDANMRRHLMSSKDSLGPHHELNNIQVGNGSFCHQLFFVVVFHQLCVLPSDNIVQRSHSLDEFCGVCAVMGLQRL